MTRTHRSSPAAVLAAAALALAGACSRDARTRAEVVDPTAPGGLEPELRAVADRLLEGRNPFLGRRRLERLEHLLGRGGLWPDAELEARHDLAGLLLQHGEVDRALAEVQAAEALARSTPDLARSLRPLLHLKGVALLRKAEVQNCIDRHDRECCIFPLRGGGEHDLRSPALEARQVFENLLEAYPDDLAHAWLLNLTGMALGEYPEGVPRAWRIPPAAFESEEAIGRFVDVAGELGVDTLNLCGGVVVEDFDGDRRLDIATSTFDPRGPLTLYLATADGRFRDASRAAGLDGQLGGLNCIGADYDADGDVDLLVLRGAWLFDQGRIPNSLLRNEGDATFRDVTRAAGLADPAYPTQAACWGDFDGDGDLDLYVVNESRVEIGPPVGDFPSQLFLNEGDGTFRDAALAAGVTNDRYAKGVTAGDFDNDGDLDLYVSNVGPNRLYRNRGDGSFEDVAEELGVVEPRGRSFATWFFDYDNDGWLDLFVAGYDATVEDVVADYLGRPHQGLAPRLYRNTGGAFADVTAEIGLDRAFLPMGANFGDLDGDGFLDLFLATGDPAYETLVPNVALKNDRGRLFLDVTTSAGLGHLQKGHGVAFADIDGDGDQDVYNQLGGFYPGDAFHNALWRNPGHGNRFLHVSLVGARLPGAEGARLCARFVEGGVEREIHRAVGSVSSFGGSPRRQELGLGRAERIEALEVRWPGGGELQVEREIPLDTWIEVRQGEEVFRETGR